MSEQERAPSTPPINEQRQLLRKLPRFWRKVNVLYQVLIAGLGGLNLMLAVLNGSDSISVPILYFEILSVLETFIPLGWSKLLDIVKEYEDDLTPDNLTPRHSPIVRHHQNEHNEDEENNA